MDWLTQLRGQTRDGARSSCRWMGRPFAARRLAPEAEKEAEKGTFYFSGRKVECPLFSFVVRELRFQVAQRGFRSRQITLVTTLVDSQRYPTEELAALYRQRWQVELNFRHLKQTMHMDVLRCKTLEGIHKELTMFAIVYNLVRAVMLEASRRQHVPLERISFTDALRWLAHAPPGSVLAELVVNPDRRNRLEPRVRKRRPKEYPLMTKPRAELRKALLGKASRD